MNWRLINQLCSHFTLSSSITLRHMHATHMLRVFKAVELCLLNIIQIHVRQHHSEAVITQVIALCNVHLETMK